MDAGAVLPWPTQWGGHASPSRRGANAAAAEGEDAARVQEGGGEQRGADEDRGIAHARHRRVKGDAGSARHAVGATPTPQTGSETIEVRTVRRESPGERSRSDMEARTSTSRSGTSARLTDAYNVSKAFLLDGASEDPAAGPIYRADTPHRFTLMREVPRIARDEIQASTGWFGLRTRQSARLRGPNHPVLACISSRAMRGTSRMSVNLCGVSAR